MSKSVWDGVSDMENDRRGHWAGDVAERGLGVAERRERTRRERELMCIERPKARYVR